MIHQLAELMMQVQSRYARVWAGGCLPLQLPAVGNVNHLFDAVERAVRERVTVGLGNPADEQIKRVWFCQLYAMQRCCCIHQWPEPLSAKEMIRAWWLHDLLVYSRWLLLLHHANHYTEGWFDDAGRPSLSCLTLRCCGEDVSIRCQLPRELAQHVDALCELAYINPYEMVVCRLAEAARSTGLPAATAALIVVVADSLLYFAPESLHQERQLTHFLSALHRQLMRRCCDGAALQPMQWLTMVLRCQGMPAEVLDEALQAYLAGWTTDVDHCLLAQEMDEWEAMDVSRLPDGAAGMIQTVLHRLGKLCRMPHEPELPPELRIQWGGTVKEFVSLFHPLIVKKRLLLKGNNDLLPLVGVLGKIFAIDKSRGEGLLAVESLISYFKRANAGEE